MENIKNFMTDKKTIVYIAILIFYLVIFPILTVNKEYIQTIVITATILSIIGLGVWLTFSIGRINIGQAAFASIGGYTTAILLTKLGLSFWICLPLSGIIAAFLAAILGLAILRLKGVYFSMLTLTLTLTVMLLFLNIPKLSNGANGIMNIPRPDALKIFGLTIIPDFKEKSHLSFYFLSAFLMLLTLGIVWRINTSRLGWVFRALRESEELASSIGINIVKYRIIAYAICSFLGGIGGSIFTVFIQNIFPANFQVTDSIYYMLYCFLGGLDYVVGPVVGSFILTVSYELLRPVQKYQEGIYAILMIVLMLWLPNGILSIKLRRRKDK